MPKPYSGGKRKRTPSSGVVKLARAITRASGPSPMQGVVFGGVRAPLSTRGFYGTYTQRGRSELKVIENAPAVISTVTQAGSTTLYNGVAQGSDFTNRIGRKIIVKSILFRGAVYPNATSDNAGDVVRVMLVWDSQPNSAGTNAAVTDILTTADVFSGVNLNNRDRFRVLYDKRFIQNANVYSAGVLTVGNPITQYKEKYLKCNYEQIFSGTGATIGSISTGSLLMLAIALQNTCSSLSHYCRVRFSDA